MFKKNLNNHRCSGPGCQHQPNMYQQGFNPGMMNEVPQGMQMQGSMQPGMQPGIYPGMQPGMQPESSIYPQVQEDRLQFEIRENRRRINNLTRRVIRLENYLRIRDTSEYANLDDDQLQNEFTM